MQKMLYANVCLCVGLVVLENSMFSAADGGFPLFTNTVINYVIMTSQRKQVS